MWLLETVMSPSWRLQALTWSRPRSLPRLPSAGSCGQRGAWGFPWFPTRRSDPPSQQTTPSGQINCHPPPRVPSQNGPRAARDVLCFSNCPFGLGFYAKARAVPALMSCTEQRRGKDETAFQSLFPSAKPSSCVPAFPGRRGVGGANPAGRQEDRTSRWGL